MTSTKQDAVGAKVVLRMLGKKGPLSSNSVQARIMRFMAALDAVILRIPEEAPKDMVDELDRIITTLRTAQQAAEDNSMQGAVATLDLAGARIERFAKVVEEYDPPEST